MLKTVALRLRNASQMAASGDRRSQPVPPGDYPVVVVGSGPGGLQTSYFLRHLGIDHALISADPAARRHVPPLPVLPAAAVVDQAVRAGAARSDRFYEWYDWNSLLAEEQQHRAIMPTLMDGTSSFPSRPEMEHNLATFVERTGLEVRYDCRWEATRRDGDRFVLTTSDGDYRCQVAIFAVGVAQPFKPDTPGFDLAPHYVETRPAETYAGKRLFIIGKENSGFELATGLLQWAQRIVLASPRPAKLSVNTHSLLGVRARYIQPFEDEILGGGVFILNASIDARRAQRRVVSACTASAPRAAASSSSMPTRSSAATGFTSPAARPAPTSAWRSSAAAGCRR